MVRPHPDSSAGKRLQASELRQREDDRIVELTSRAMTRDARAASELLPLIATRIQEGAALPFLARQYVAAGLHAMASDPPGAVAHFGMTAAANRPAVESAVIYKVLTTVEHLRNQYVPLNNNRNGDGAFSKAGEEHGVSADLVKREWHAYQRWQRDKAKGESS